MNLPYLDKIKLEDYYLKMAESKYVISPIGDRDDCYRHYEAIGLGCIPISNINKELYGSIFEDSMYYCDINEMINIFKGTTENKLNYKTPNKDLICLDYYRDLITTIINKLK